MKESKPSYYAVIPAPVRYCLDLPIAARMLYGEISALSSREGFCWATNRYFAMLYDVNPNTVSEWIQALVKNQFIRAEIGRSGNRKLFLMLDTPTEKSGGGSRKIGRGSPEKSGAVLNNTTSTTTTTTFGEDSPEFKIAKRLLDLIRSHDPGYREPDLHKWATHVDALLRIDKRSLADVAFVVEWCQRDSFWQSNILSTKKLREKFTTLLLKAKGGNNARQGSGYKGFNPGKYPSVAQS